MKRFNLFFAMLFATLIANAQLVDKDYVGADGSRTIISEDYKIAEDREVSLVYYIPSGSTKAVKMLQFELDDCGKMAKGKSLLIKFKDGSIMELKNHCDANTSLFDFDDDSKPRFIVSDAQLQKICNTKVVKLRFDYGSNLIDVYANGSMSSSLKRCKKALDSVCISKRGDIRAGF